MKKQAGSDRRTFLGMLGLGAVAGPGAVEGVIKDHGFNALGQAGAAIRYASGEGEEMDEADDYSTGDSKYTKKEINKKDYYTKRVKNAIKNFNEEKTRDRSGELSHFMRLVQRLDPDLLSNRSLSLYARTRIQAQRNLRRDSESQLTYKEQYITSALKQLRSYVTDNECFDLVLNNIVRDKFKPPPTLEAFIKVLGPREEED